MNVELIVGLLAAATTQKQPPIWTTLLPMVFIFVIFWVLLIRPQQKKQKALDLLVKELKVNDRVMAGGIVDGGPPARTLPEEVERVTW